METKPEYVAFNHTLKLPNCRELLGRKIRLLWMQDGTEVYFRIKVHMDLAQYAALGIAAEGSPMIDADFVRIFFNQSANQFATQDAFLSKQLNCDFITGGLCTDEQVFWIRIKIRNHFCVHNLIYFSYCFTLGQKNTIYTEAP